MPWPCFVCGTSQDCHHREAELVIWWRSFRHGIAVRKPPERERGLDGQSKPAPEEPCETLSGWKASGRGREFAMLDAARLAGPLGVSARERYRVLAEERRAVAKAELFGRKTA
jgi:hypothetical protein